MHSFRLYYLKEFVPKSTSKWVKWRNIDLFWKQKIRKFLECRLLNLHWPMQLRKKEVQKTKYYPKYSNSFLSELWFFWLIGWIILGGNYARSSQLFESGFSGFTGLTITSLVWFERSLLFVAFISKPLADALRIGEKKGIK